MWIFNTAPIRLWKSLMPVSNEKFLITFLRFVTNITSISVGLFDLKQVGSVITFVRFSIGHKRESVLFWSILKFRSPMITTFSYFVSIVSAISLNLFSKLFGVILGFLYIFTTSILFPLQLSSIDIHSKSSVHMFIGPNVDGISLFT